MLEVDERVVDLANLPDDASMVLEALARGRGRLWIEVDERHVDALADQVEHGDEVLLDAGEHLLRVAARQVVTRLDEERAEASACLVEQRLEQDERVQHVDMSCCCLCCRGHGVHVALPGRVDAVRLDAHELDVGERVGIDAADRVYVGRRRRRRDRGCWRECDACEAGAHAVGRRRRHLRRQSGASCGSCIIGCCCCRGCEESGEVVDAGEDRARFEHAAALFGRKEQRCGCSHVVVVQALGITCRW